MDEGFESEFYRSPWQRVLPVGPHGIQPYVQTSRAGGRPIGRLHGLVGLLAVVAGDFIGRAAARAAWPRGRCR